MSYEGSVQKVSEEKNIRDHSCDVLTKNVAAFCPLSKKNLSKTKLKRFGQMSLVETSKQPSTDCAIWLSVITITQIYNEKEPIMQKETENKIYSWGGEYTGVYVTLEPSKPTEMRSLKKGLMLN